MNRQWEFTDLELRVLWERYIGGSLPEPLTYTSRIRYADEYEQEAFRIWEYLQDTVGGSIREVLEALAHPELLLRVMGWYDRDMDDPQRWIRARVVRSGPRGYVLTQKPGETIAHSGGYTITECGPHGVADAAVRLLPPVEAGRSRSIPITLDQEDVLEQIHGGASMVLESGGESEVRRGERFLNTPADRTGVIILNQGRSKFGPRGILEQILLWRDLPDDGRYVIEVGSSAPTAVGIGRQELVARLDDAIESMLKRLENHWEIRE
ncbi:MULTISPECIES: ESX secretion-associated protein EspG [unclassified Nocardia]|uniref:ESX secretion-associated protein EspG n=1 Tax=unclassified Nocardia TaxID=2637762 RepID=UPI001CE4672F|nr:MULTISPECIES: ESX secretion-associated protein EspG [unclassified Nocardia]